MPRSDLLDYLERYRATPRRRLARAERWRRRGWSRKQVVVAAEALAADLHAAGLGSGDRVGLWLKDGPTFAAGLFGALRAGCIVVPIDLAWGPETAARMAGSLELAGWIADEELAVVGHRLPAFEVRWKASGPRDEQRPSAEASARGNKPASDLATDTERPDRSAQWPPTRPDSSNPLPPWPVDNARHFAELVLTSGTTGDPQPVELRHENLRAVLDALEGEIDRYRWLMRLAPRLRLAVALPLSHLYGQYMGLLLPVLLDADVTMLESMPAKRLAEAMRRERARVLATVPRTLSLLLDHLLAVGRERWGEDGLRRRLAAAEGMSWPRRWLLFDPLRRRLGRRLVAVVSGGASLDTETERLWRLLGYVVVQGYGLTEAAPLVTLNHPFRPRGGSVGAPLPGVEVRVASDGEILVRGANVGRPASLGPRLDEDGWLHTGDLGEVLDDGSIGFRGRRSDRIVTPAGVNVDVAEIAAMLRAAPGVVDALVVERPWGEPGAVCAVLTVRPGTDIDALVRDTNRELPDAARLRAWFVWPYGDLPRTSTGKVRRAPVLEWLGRRGSTEDADGQTLRGSGSAASDDPARDGACATGSDDPGAYVLGQLGPTGPSTPRARLGELLGSLERVELAGRLEDLYGVTAAPDVFTGEATLGELSAWLAAGRDPTSSSRGSLGAAVEIDRGSDSRSATGAREAPPRGLPIEGDSGSTPGDAAEGHTSRAVGAAAARAARHQHPPAARWRHTWPARTARFLLRETVIHPLTRSLLRLEVTSEVPLDELRTPFLLAANHASYLDPVVMFALPPRTRARLAPAARWNFFTGRPRGRFLYFWGVLGLNLFPLLQTGDWRATLRLGGELADRGHSLLIYPEGAIARDGEPAAFRQGVAVMSRELHLPLVPCATAGLERVLPPGSRRPRRPGWRRPRVVACFGAPLPAVRPGEDLAARTEVLESTVRRLRERAMSRMR